MEDTNGEIADSTQEVATLTNQHWTDTGPMEAEASKVAAEEAEDSKAEASLEEEDSKPEDRHLVTIIKIIRISTAMVPHQQSHHQISTNRVMLHLATQARLHRVDIGMEINIIITEIQKKRPELQLNVFRLAKCSIGPIHSCHLLVLRTEAKYHTAEV